MATHTHFYVTLYSNASRYIYEQNTHADFTVKLTQPVEVGSTSNWEKGVCEISSSSSQPIEDSPALMYSNLISPHFVGDRTVRSMRTFVFSSSSCQHEILNVYYMPAEQRRF